MLSPILLAKCPPQPAVTSCDSKANQFLLFLRCTIGSIIEVSKPAWNSDTPYTHHNSLSQYPCSAFQVLAGSPQQKPPLNDEYLLTSLQTWTVLKNAASQIVRVLHGSQITITSSSPHLLLNGLVGQIAQERRHAHLVTPAQLSQLTSRNNLNDGGKLSRYEASSCFVCDGFNSWKNGPSRVDECWWWPNLANVSIGHAD